MDWFLDGLGIFVVVGNFFEEVLGEGLIECVSILIVYIVYLEIFKI